MDDFNDDFFNDDDFVSQKRRKKPKNQKALFINIDDSAGSKDSSNRFSILASDDKGKVHSGSNKKGKKKKGHLNGSLEASSSVSETSLSEGNDKENIDKTISDKTKLYNNEKKIGISKERKQDKNTFATINQNGKSSEKTTITSKTNTECLFCQLTFTTKIAFIIMMISLAISLTFFSIKTTALINLAILVTISLIIFMKS